MEENVTRRGIAKELAVDVGRLRHWERVGLLPAFRSVPVELYRDRVTLILTALKRLSMKRLREALALGGF